MAFCAYCGHQISELAATCPNCGHPNEARSGIPEVQFNPPDPAAQRELAGFWIRLGAVLIDGIIIGIVAAPFGTVHTTHGNVILILDPFRNVAQFLYAWLMIGLVRGQTLGMMALGLRITRPDGAPVDLGRAAARAAMAYVSGIALLLGYLWALWDTQKRTWHDMVADTRVYRVLR